uniref:Peptidyl-prolyl cis-trans isomerase n=1 Tax=Oryza rufipogon TaxID=4529 RepID=A0A0E0Q1G4_ORYRU
MSVLIVTSVGDIEVDLHTDMCPLTTKNFLKLCKFYITLRDGVDYLDDKHTVFGMVAEGFDTITKINETYVDDKGRPFKDIRIRHTYVLDDPFDDPPQLSKLIPENSPVGKPQDEIAEERLEDNWVPPDETVAPEELEDTIRSKEAHTNAVILQSLGDIPDAEIKPQDNVLFVRELNKDEDLYTIFSHFGSVTSAEIIRDYKTGDSLCFAFIEFEKKEACERAFFMMDNCLIDDRRIRVDFSQSVSKQWRQFRQSKSNANKDGCFKCGALDLIARDCDQRAEQKNKGPNYILKDENTQRSGNKRRSYDLVFEDGENYNGQQDLRSADRRKIHKIDDRRSGLPPRGDRDRISRERTHIDENDKEGNRDRGNQKHEDYNRYCKPGERSSSRHDDRGYSKHESRSKYRDGDDDYRRQSGGSRYGRDKCDGERRYRGDDDHGRSNRHTR